MIIQGKIQMQDKYDLYRVITHLQTDFTILSYDTNNSKIQSHDDYELYFLVDGKRLFFTENSFYELEKGDLLMILPGVVHAFIDAKPSKYTRAAINISPQFLEPLLGTEFERRACSSNGVIFVRAPQIHSSVMEEFDMIYKNKDTSNEKFIFITMSLIYKLVYHLLTLEPTVVSTNGTFQHNKRLAEILKYITLNCTKPLTISHISGKFFISEYHLCRIFKRYIGKSILEYIIFLRIEKAKGALRSYPEKKIREIAKECGFSTVTHFNHMFQKQVQMSPSQYRQLHS